MNWLDRMCNKSSRTTSCVEEPLDYDSLAADRSLTFRDAAGARHRVTNGHWLWTVAHDHSIKCVRAGDMHGCFTTEPGIGRVVVLHSGMAISLTFINRH